MRRSHATESAQARILVCWTLFDGGGRSISCELCRTAQGLEVQCAAGREFRRTPVTDMAAGLAIAETWKREFITDGQWSACAPEQEALGASEHRRKTTVLDGRARRTRGGDLRRRDA